jgi:PTH1 family peptidyl-tRNA hydrolase
MQTPIQLIVGLGNPGPKYQATRHNAGFWWLDALAAKEGAVFKPDPRCQGQVAEIKVAGKVCRLLKPQTFMNLSGTAVQALAHFYKIAPAAILVVHDELDLACGVAKIKWSGGHAGHNGLRDIQAKLATQDYWRLRIGIDHPRRQSLRLDVADYVLGVPPLDSKIAIDVAIARSYAIVPALLTGALDQAQQQLHCAL